MPGGRAACGLKTEAIDLLVCCCWHYSRKAMREAAAGRIQATDGLLMPSKGVLEGLKEPQLFKQE